MQHECELAEAITFHKMQGKTVESIILSLNSRSDISKKILPVSLPSLYVGSSRVHNHDHLRILPLSEKDKNALKKLKWDPYLKTFFENYDESGKWKVDGLKEKRQKRIKLLKLDLGMTKLTALTKKEAYKFARDLDLIVDSTNTNPTAIEYQNALQKTHEEGCELLNANNGLLLKKYQKNMKEKLKKQNVNNFSLKQARFYAKRLEIETKSSKKSIQKKLLNWIKTPQKTPNNNQTTKSDIYPNDHKPNTNNCKCNKCHINSI